MSTSCKSSHNSFLDVSCSNGGLRISGWIGQLSCLTIFSTSLSVAAFLRRAGGSMLECTGSHKRNVEWRVPEMYHSTRDVPEGTIGNGKVWHIMYDFILSVSVWHINYTQSTNNNKHNDNDDDDKCTLWRRRLLSSTADCSRRSILTMWAEWLWLMLDTEYRLCISAVIRCTLHMSTVHIPAQYWSMHFYQMMRP